MGKGKKDNLNNQQITSLTSYGCYKVYDKIFITKSKADDGIRWNSL